MIRQTITPRADWRAKVEELGLIWHTVDGRPYWDESAYYSFTLGQIEEIEAATTELYRLFVEAGQHVVDTPGLLASFGIPAFCHDAVRAAWNDEPPALNYGRFDLGYDGRSPPKLFESTAIRRRRYWRRRWCSGPGRRTCSPRSTSSPASMTS